MTDNFQYLKIIEVCSRLLMCRCLQFDMYYVQILSCYVSNVEYNINHRKRHTFLECRNEGFVSSSLTPPKPSLSARGKLSSLRRR
ncbi:hypothetical protein KC19_VG053400 [Ceratodon purpureus]|uniref:Uncharacterized protein n=1 Tax=Ceratodon purpureus TaxID=3225 RepID=A0A8T0HM71_CERPU|nr:hypothetical protein KC19_VG053400 [Ceratodon purpureus]